MRIPGKHRAWMWQLSSCPAPKQRWVMPKPIAMGGTNQEAKHHCLRRDPHSHQLPIPRLELGLTSRNGGLGSAFHEEKEAK